MYQRKFNLFLIHSSLISILTQPLTSYELLILLRNHHKLWYLTHPSIRHYFLLRQISVRVISPRTFIIIQPTFYHAISFIISVHGTSPHLFISYSWLQYQFDYIISHHMIKLISIWSRYRIRAVAQESVLCFVPNYIYCPYNFHSPRLVKPYCIPTYSHIFDE